MKIINALKRQFLYLKTFVPHLYHSLKAGNFSALKNVYVVFLLTILTYSSSQRIRKIIERQILRTSEKRSEKKYVIEDFEFQAKDNNEIDWDFNAAPIDIVYTWVDGNDPDWLIEKEDWRSRFFNDSTQELDNPASDQRFRQNDELYFSVLSIIKHAPWVRTIYVVTNGQRPSWLPKDIAKIKIVTHDQLLSKEYLPTFNSHVIESALHKIPDLSEHYIYFNDDILLNKDVTPYNFFNRLGTSYAFLGVTRPPASNEISNENNTWTNVNLGSVNLLIDNLNVEIGDRALGEIAKRELIKQRLPTFPGHNPHPQLKSRLIRLEEDYGQLLNLSRENKFRTNNDISLASSLQIYSGLLDGTAMQGRWRSNYIRTGSAQRLIWLLNLGWSSRKTSICLNDATESPHRELPSNVVGAILGIYLHSREQ